MTRSWLSDSRFSLKLQDCKCTLALHLKEVMDEQYLNKEAYEVTTEEPEIGETPHEGSFGIDMDWLNETLRELKWTDETTISFLAKYNIGTEGTLLEVIARLNREQAVDFTKTLQSKAGSL